MTVVTPVVEDWLEQEIAQWVHYEEMIQWPIAPWADALTTEVHLTPQICPKVRGQVQKKITCFYHTPFQDASGCLISHNDTSGFNITTNQNMLNVPLHK